MPYFCVLFPLVWFISDSIGGEGVRGYLWVYLSPVTPATPVELGRYVTGELLGLGRELL